MSLEINWQERALAAESEVSFYKSRLETANRIGLAITKERDALRDKLAEIEAQEPVGGVIHAGESEIILSRDSMVSVSIGDHLYALPVQPSPAVAVPEFLLEMSKQIREQDSRSTSHPFWQVRCKRYIVTEQGYNEHHWEICGDDGVIYRSLDPIEELHEYLIENHSEFVSNWNNYHDAEDIAEWFDATDDNLPDGLRLVYVQEIEEVVSTHLTEVGAKAFIDRKQHDYPKLYTYVESAYWSPQLRQLQDWIISLSTPTPPSAEQCCCENPEPKSGAALVSNCCPKHNVAPVQCHEAWIYSAACELIEDWNKKRLKAGLQLATEGSLLDGISSLLAMVEQPDSATVEPVENWVKCSERLPTKKDADLAGNVICKWNNGEIVAIKWSDVEVGDDNWLETSQTKPQRITEQDAREILESAIKPLRDVELFQFSDWWHYAGRTLLAKLNEHRESDYKAHEWQPIETFPSNAKSDYSFALVAWGPDGDKSTGFAVRYKNEWFAGALFYCGGPYDQRQYEYRETKINPSHWMTEPDVPAIAKASASTDSGVKS